MLVEPSCGAALAAGYSGVIRGLIESNFIRKSGPIVFVVCGGNIVSLDDMNRWKEQFNLN